MSTFTRFTADEQLTFDKEASRILGKTYYRVIPGFRYYIGQENSDKYVDIPTGFLTDGASVPFIFQWLISPLGEYSQATTLHDYLCEHYEITQVINGVPTQVRIDRKEVDRILYEAMRVLEVAAWRRNVIQVGIDGYRVLTNPTKPVINRKKVELENGSINQVSSDSIGNINNSSIKAS
ncbi:tail assembly chaperone [Pseudomonas phage Psa21]|uniref:DUF1353 domain-containing protein n=1 Tax=Pseudomonas phage Psa21 TaxID=2530023 RepID=A0A481W5E9_9CAUD|nr:tail assembly chaperone [Pseudomonas phage Psa21]QBJ02942.1 hypothetical protein PSA21_424 [Pseudomonas phage Psa21]